MISPIQLVRHCLAALLIILVMPSCNCTKAKPQPVAAAPTPVAKKSPHSLSGIASIYHDKITATGERYKSSAMAAAHKTLPLGCKVRVINLRNSKSCVVRINDRGPYVKGRVIDLTPAAASAIGLTWTRGLTPVRLERL